MLEGVDKNCIEGVELEIGASGRLRYVRVDLERHPVFDAFLRQNNF